MSEIEQIPPTVGFKRLVVISNRLPVILKQDATGQWHIQPGQGGLVTALAPVLRHRGGLWIGWPGTTVEGIEEIIDTLQSDDIGYSLRPVTLSKEEEEKYYHGFSNEILWPLFHDLLDRCNFDPEYWPIYCQVNRKFAEAIAQHTQPEDYIWVQDYHLMLLADQMRQAGIERQAGFFLHIPFPSQDIFMKLPWRHQVIQALLEYDLIGLQTVRDLRNCINCIRAMVPGSHFTSKGMAATLTTPTRKLRLGAFPIGIDDKKFIEKAHSEEVATRAWYIHEDLPERKLILGVDRLDYTKGIPHRIRAFGKALEKYPDLLRKVTFIQVVVPSRAELPEYAELRMEVEQLVGKINGQHTQSGWSPIHYIYRSLDFTELVSYYRTAEIALVTPLKDGMNLVAKEYCACSLEEGVLILSEFAGAAAQFNKAALLVNPYDIDGLADVIYQAFTMESRQRRSRMRKLRQSTIKQNVFWWVDAFLTAAISLDLSCFPQIELFVPGNQENDTNGYTP